MHTRHQLPTNIHAYFTRFIKLLVRVGSLNIVSQHIHHNWVDMLIFFHNLFSLLCIVSQLSGHSVAVWIVADDGKMNQWQWPVHYPCDLLAARTIRTVLRSERFLLLSCVGTGLYLGSRAARTHTQFDHFLMSSKIILYEMPISIPRPTLSDHQCSRRNAKSSAR